METGRQRITLLLILVCTAFQCTSQKKDSFSTNYKNQSRKLAMWNGAKDTTIKVELIDSIFYSFKFDMEGKYRIIWGNTKLQKLSTKEYDGLGDGNLGLYEFSNKGILLGQNCGQKCQIRIALPLSENGVEKEFFPSILTEYTKNIVVWIPNKTSKMRVENYLTNKFEDVQISDFCSAADWVECIDKIYLKNSQLFIEYQGSNWTDTKPDPKKKIVDIKNLE